MVVVIENCEENVYCAGCRVLLAPYEVFAARIRGLKKPVCIGCLIEALLFLKDDLKPMLEEALIRLMEYAEKEGDPGRKVKIHERRSLCLKLGRWTLFLGFGEVQPI